MIFATLCAALALSAAKPTQAPLSPEALVLAVKENFSAQSETAELTMRLIDAGGKVKIRTATAMSKKKEDGRLELMRLIRFHSPPEMDKAAVLTLENPQGQDDQWVFIPATFTSRRIPSASRHDRYMGTDFSYEDVSSVKLEENRFARLGEEDVDGVRCVIIERTPSDPKLASESGYSKSKLWIDPGRRVTLREDFFDKQGKLCKRMRNTRIESFGTHYRPRMVEMVDLQSMHATQIEYGERKIDPALPAGDFTVRYLERGG